MILIGIDPGAKTGLAIWDTEKKIFERVETFKDYWYCVFLLRTYIDCNKKSNLRAYIENSNIDNVVFGSQKTARNVGKNQQRSQDMVDFFKHHGIETVEIAPSSRKRGLSTKLNAETFAKLTNYQHRTSEHSRDAAMLVWNRRK